MEVDAASSGSAPRRCSDIYVRPPSGAPVPLARVHPLRADARRALAVNHQGQFPSVTLSFNLAPGVALGEAVDAIEARDARSSGCPPTIRGQLPGHGAGVPGLAGEPAAADPRRAASPSTSCSACSTRATSTRSRSSRRCRRRASARSSRCSLCRTELERDRADRHHPADRHREEERDHDDRLRARGRARRRARARASAIYQACLLRFRPIMMTTMAALLGALPLALGTGVGSELRRPLGIAIVGGLIVSQMLTLYTTPVVYLYLDRAAAGSRRDGAAARARAPPRPRRSRAAVHVTSVVDARAARGRPSVARRRLHGRARTTCGRWSRRPTPTRSSEGWTIAPPLRTMADPRPVVGASSAIPS